MKTITCIVALCTAACCFTSCSNTSQTHTATNSNDTAVLVKDTANALNAKPINDTTVKH